MSQNTLCQSSFPYRAHRLARAVRCVPTVAASPFARDGAAMRRSRVRLFILSSRLHDGARNAAATAVIGTDAAALSALRLNDRAGGRGDGVGRGRHCEV